jgi:hypothetical protein
MSFIKDKEERILSDDQEIKDRWKEYLPPRKQQK